jgi:hypothetical protein
LHLHDAHRVRRTLPWAIHGGTQGARDQSSWASRSGTCCRVSGSDSSATHRSAPAARFRYRQSSTAGGLLWGCEATARTKKSPYRRWWRLRRSTMTAATTSMGRRCLMNVAGPRTSLDHERRWPIYVDARWWRLRRKIIAAATTFMGPTTFMGAVVADMVMPAHERRRSDGGWWRLRRRPKAACTAAGPRLWRQIEHGRIVTEIQILPRPCPAFTAPACARAERTASAAAGGPQQGHCRGPPAPTGAPRTPGARLLTPVGLNY